MQQDSALPLYSLVMFGRNDDYNPDFVYRMQTALNFNARALERVGRLADVEFVVVDWGSVAPLREALVLEEPAASATVFWELSTDLAAQVSGVVNGMHVTKAFNAGIKRARGKFIGTHGADILMMDASWRSLLSALDNQCDGVLDLSRSCLLIPRRQVPWSFVARQPSLEVWKRKLLTCDKATTESEGSSPSTAGGMGITILQRDIWEEVKGLEEAFGGYGYSDIDLGFRVGRQYPWIDAASFGVVCYKMQHDPNGRRGRLLQGGTIPINAPWITPNLFARQDEWGLPNVTIEPMKAISQVTQRHRASVGRWQGRFSGGVPVDPSLFTRSNVCQHASAALGRSQDFDERDWELLRVLSWFALNKFPMNYLEIDFVDNRYVRAVSAACPSVDLYVLESVQELCDGRAPYSAQVAMDLLWQWNHKGYFRPLIGDPSVTLDYLAKSFIGPFELELAVVNINSERLTELLPRVLSAVTPGGLLAIRSTRAEWIATALKISVPLAGSGSSIFVGHSGCTAFMFISDRDTRSTQTIVHNQGYHPLPPTALHTMLRLRAAVLFRQLQSTAVRLCHVSRWAAYVRIILAKISMRR